MKKTIALLSIFAIISFSLSCKKKEKLTEFNIDYSTTLSIPSSSITVGSPTTTAEFNTPNVPTQQSSKFSSEGTAQSLIDKILMTKFNITNTTAGGNLDFLRSMTIYFKAANVGEQLIATKTSFPTGIASTSLDLTDTNIKDYIFQDNIQFRVVIGFDASSSQNQTLKMDETVTVNAKLKTK